MKHFLKKKLVQGAGWRSKPRVPDPQPSILRAPNMAGYKILQSYSVMEIIDLISDGPIHGLVNKNGESLTNKGILQAIYLDNTPVQGTPDPFEEISEKQLGFFDIASTLNIIGDVYYEKETPEADPFFKPITATIWSYVTSALYSQNYYGIPQDLVINEALVTSKSHVIFASIILPITHRSPPDTTMDYLIGFSQEWYTPDFSSFKVYSYPPRSNTPFKTDWQLIHRGTGDDNWFWGTSTGFWHVQELIFTKTKNNQEIEINITKTSLG